MLLYCSLMTRRALRMNDIKSRPFHKAPNDCDRGDH